MALTPFVTRARELRFAARWSQMETAQRAGLSQTTISAIERGLPVSPLLLERLGHALGCDPAKLQERVFDPAAAEEQP